MSQKKLNYSPKLKEAAEEIKAILKKHDIAAVVLLHTPGFGEFINHFTPSYSCVKLVNDGKALEIKASAAEYPDKEEKHRVIGDTYNMLTILCEMGAHQVEQLFALHDTMTQAMGGNVEIEHGDTTITPHKPEE